ncbi:hypothetical protein DAI22_09g117100 [Oryza sativa Japonica Group]|nr:hypothetical protein DAI22_09g117100 [Oryza sativa Japonica Group]
MAESNGEHRRQDAEEAAHNVDITRHPPHTQGQSSVRALRSIIPLALFVLSPALTTLRSTMATGGSSSSSNVPSGGAAGGGAGSGKLPMVPVGSIECLRKRCRQLRVLIHVNDHRKAVVVLHAGEDGKPDHVLVQNVSPEGEASVQSTYRIDVSGETPESQAEMLNDWYTSFRMDTTGVLYDSDQNVIYGVPRGHPGGDVPRSLAILPPAPKKNQHGKAPATESNSSLVEEPLLLVQTDQPAAIGKRKKFTFPDQRKRVKTMTKKDLESYFHITQKSAAHIGLSIGTTALKNLCRANDLPRWPYRQIASLDNKFNNNLKKQITGWNLGKAVQGVTKAFKLRKEKEEFYQKIMSSMPEQLQSIDEIVNSLPEADDDIDIEDDEDNDDVIEDNDDDNSDEN